MAGSLVWIVAALAVVLGASLLLVVLRGLGGTRQVAGVAAAVGELAGRLSQLADSQAAQQAALEYRQTVLTALQEVENALIVYAKEQERRRSLAAAAVASRRSVELATTLYTQGQTDFLNVLSAQRALLQAEAALVQSDRTLASALIQLYKALGGGW